ncbi:hypothetical protein [Vibrio metschnikovii]|uniref:Uncharacterized protein n=1 Tax=Vibrio metschnikovii TaxID=28172 RepID=A0A9X0R9E5_VIBME|nr:hypothetical protein [Vibrio metschnikovii]MBC5852112.1 hypothetical protein [Vibrio metschnikovii]
MNKAQKAEMYAEILAVVEQLEAVSPTNLSHYTNEKAKSLAAKLAVEAPRSKVTFEDGNSIEVEMYLHAAVELCRSKVEDCAIHTQAAEDEMNAHNSGDDTEFDPFKMEVEANEMKGEVNTLLANFKRVLKAKVAA